MAEKIGEEIDQYSFKQAIKSFLELSSFGNTDLQEVSPWKLFKTEPDSQVIKDCIYQALQTVGLLSIYSKPFLPFISDKIRDLLNLPHLKNGDIASGLHGKELVVPGHLVGEPQILFAKIDDRKDQSRMEIVNAQKEKLAGILAAQKPKQPALKEEITYDDFTKMDLRIGTILTAEKVKKADKLLKLEVDLGFEKRTLVSGIAKFYKPENIIGQQVMVLTNLAPRKIRGVVSKGMILMAENEKGELTFVAPSQEWENGFPVA